MKENELMQCFLGLLKRAGQLSRPVWGGKASAHTPETFLAATLFDQQDIGLIYTDELLSLPSEVIRAVLSHEVCHVITLPTSNT